MALLSTLVQSLPEKAPAAVRASAPVSVHDDLSARQAGIPLRPADFKPARGIDVKFRVSVEQRRGNHLVRDVLFEVRAQFFLRHLRVVLGRNDHRIHAHGALVLVLHGHLRLSVRAEIGQKPALAHLAQPHGELVGKHDGQGHQLLRFAAGVTEHHALVPRAERILRRTSPRLVLIRGIDPHRDIGRLLVNRHRNAALVPGEGAEIVADAADDFPRRRLVIHLRPPW